MKVVEGGFGKQQQKDQEDDDTIAVEEVLQAFQETLEDLKLNEIIIIGRRDEDGAMVLASNVDVTEQVYLMDAMKFSLFSSMVSMND